MNDVSTTEALMTDPTTPEGTAYWQQRRAFEEHYETGDQLEDALAEVNALRRALADVEVLAREASETMYAAAELARMVRTNQTNREDVA